MLKLLQCNKNDVLRLHTNTQIWNVAVLLDKRTELDSDTDKL